MEFLRIRNWDKWQTYRKDRGQPPWIKVHRRLMRDPHWVQLTDAERGQLVAIWLLAADREGVIPASSRLIQKLCYMENEPDLRLFAKLGFIEVSEEWRQRDANMASKRRQHDRPEAEAEAEAETEKSTDTNVSVSSERLKTNHSEPTIIELPTNNCKPFCVTQSQIDELAPLYPAVDVLAELNKARGWLLGNPTRRKTHRGMMRFVTSWMSRQQDRGGTRKTDVPKETSLERIERLAREAGL